MIPYKICKDCRKYILAVLLNVTGICKECAKTRREKSYIDYTQTPEKRADNYYAEKFILYNKRKERLIKEQKERKNSRAKKDPALVALQRKEYVKKNKEKIRTYNNAYRKERRRKNKELVMFSQWAEEDAEG